MDGRLLRPDHGGVRWERVAAAIAAVGVLAGCGGGREVTTAGGGACSVPPTGSEDVAPPLEGLSTTTSATPGQRPTTTASAPAGGQLALQRMVDEYGATQAEFTRRLPLKDGRIRVGFRAHVSEHRAALAERTHGGALDVVADPFVGEAADAVQAAVPEGALLGSSDGLGLFDLRLRAGNEALAAKLYDRFGGEALRISTGRIAVAPPGCPGEPPPPSTCGLLTADEPAAAGVQVTVDLPATLTKNGVARGKLTVRNTSGHAQAGLQLPRDLVGYLVHPGTRTAVTGGYAPTFGFDGSNIVGGDLPVGGAETVDVSVEAGACDGPSSAVPTGRYGVRIAVRLREDGPTVLSPEAPIEVRG
jgi:hypothetical protein